MRMLVTALTRLACLLLALFPPIPRAALASPEPCLPGCSPPNASAAAAAPRRGERPRLEIVVAHCCEDLEWLRDLARRARHGGALGRVTIYQKCGAARCAQLRALAARGVVGTRMQRAGPRGTAR